MVRLFVPAGEGQHPVLYRALEPLEANRATSYIPAAACSLGFATTAVLSIFGKNKPGTLIRSVAAWTVPVAAMQGSVHWWDGHCAREELRSQGIKINRGKLVEFNGHTTVDDAVLLGGGVSLLLAMTRRSFPGVYGWRRYVGAAQIGCLLGSLGGHLYLQNTSNLYEMAFEQRKLDETVAAGYRALKKTGQGNVSGTQGENSLLEQLRNNMSAEQQNSLILEEGNNLPEQEGNSCCTGTGQEGNIFIGGIPGCPFSPFWVRSPDPNFPPLPLLTPLGWDLSGQKYLSPNVELREPDWNDRKEVEQYAEDLRNLDRKFSESLSYLLSVLAAREYGDSATEEWGEMQTQYLSCLADTLARDHARVKFDLVRTTNKMQGTVPTPEPGLLPIVAERYLRAQLKASREWRDELQQAADEIADPPEFVRQSMRQILPGQLERLLLELRSQKEAVQATDLVLKKIEKQIENAAQREDDDTQSSVQSDP
ncbi:hypothetical protein M011DRAFT_523802 [Sporormia fimetaria CBS 119925]|uniref:Uncharacterized protein n=1 Tax=Sporormia fimetaria CBS 119925 TaxID=1340428 RepID=A0A6A6VNR1_9PLEO|nr:hypothetical protein M011DRAFT_523802 [Sporormia fimetaria CBS 119925]